MITLRKGSDNNDFIILSGSFNATNTHNMSVLHVHVYLGLGVTNARTHARTHAGSFDGGFTSCVFWRTTQPIPINSVNVQCCDDM